MLSKRFGLSALLLVALLVIGSSAVGQVCGDLSDDGYVGIVDLIMMVSYTMGYETLTAEELQRADMDGHPGVDAGDLAFLFEFLFRGGPLPCEGPVPVPQLPGGEMGMGYGAGVIDANSIATGTVVTFYLRVINSSPVGITEVSNGFKVTSPDGAPLENVAIWELTNEPECGQFVASFEILNFADPMTADNLGFFCWDAFDDGLPVGYDHVHFAIQIGPFGPEDIGKTVTLDTTTYGNGGSWMWYGSNGTRYLPTWNGPYTFTITAPTYAPGDADNSGQVDISDITFLAEYLFAAGEEPPIPDACDANGSCGEMDISDLTYEVDYFFAGGKAPLYSCARTVFYDKANPRKIDMGTERSGDLTSIWINSPIDLRGVQLELLPSGPIEAINLTGDRLNLLSGMRDGTFRVGLLDMDGSEIVAAGSHRLIQIDGSFEIVSAVVADANHNSHEVRIVAKGETMPGEFALLQNYPNPFNPVSQIGFSLPSACHVSLDVFNLAGQKVMTLVDQPMEAGLHQVEFDGRDISTGLYLYRIKAGEFTETKKMLLVK